MHLITPKRFPISLFSGFCHFIVGVLNYNLCSLKIRIQFKCHPSLKTDIGLDDGCKASKSWLLGELIIFKQCCIFG